MTVFAAASLTEAFTDVAEAFEAQVDVDIALNFGGSSDLATQVVEGAPADVLATADLPSMERAVGAGAVARPATFATNEMVLVVEEGNPLNVDDLTSLADSDLVVVLCAPEVPCGRYAAEVAARAGVETQADSLEPSVKAVVTKVAVGEADIGVVYRTDALADSRVTAVAIPSEDNIIAEYPIALLAESSAPDAADFVAFVLGPDGREILTRHGFGAP